MVVEKVHFMLKDNHLTVEPFSPYIDEISELVHEHFLESDSKLIVYKNELNAALVRSDEFKRLLAKT